MYLPKEKILCTGDAVVNGAYNYLNRGNVANWPEVIAKAQKFEVTSVLPGHGVPGDKSPLEKQKQFLVELRKAVADAVKAGRKLEDLVKSEGGKKATTIKPSDSVQNWVSPNRYFSRLLYRARWRRLTRTSAWVSQLGRLSEESS